MERRPVGAERARQALLYRSEQQESLNEGSPYHGSSDLADYGHSYACTTRSHGYEAVRDDHASPASVGRGQPERSSKDSMLAKTPNVIQSKEFNLDNPVRQVTNTRSFLSEWWKELLAIIVSVALLAAVYGVLISIHNTRLDNWSMPFNMQPTTLIATLVTLCRLFLVAVVAEGLSQLKWVYFQEKPRRLEDIEHFDSASRSAFGAILFLSKLRWRAVAASTGALVTILALAMEPFAQQSISFHSETRPQEDALGKIPSTIAYDLGTPFQASPYNGQMNALDRKFYAPMLGSMLEGLYNPNNTVNPSCPTTNCTWAPFETLGVCATCENVAVEENCHWNDTDTKRCRYSSAHTPTLEGMCGPNAGGYKLTLWQSKADGIPKLPGIVNVTALYFPWPASMLGGEECGPNLKFPAVVTQCKLKWCIKTVSSKMRNAILTETTASSRDLVFPEHCPPDWTQPKQFATFNNITWAQVYGAFKNRNEIPNDLCSKNWLHNDKDSLHFDTPAFWINVQDHANIQILLTKIFRQHVDTAWGRPLAEMIYSVNDRNLTKDFMGIADSMTNHIRMGPNTTAFKGTVWSTDTYIRVNWLWLIYPLTLVLAGLLFLGSTVLFSTRNNGLVWKSSTLAMLFHGLVMYDGPAPFRTSEMKVTSREVWAKLDQDSRGDLKLVEGLEHVQ